ncbi:MAG: hypothetical protein LBP58_10210 [Azoarcus sp.]|nr:hypothetical protein [Azoarcus sp.]
MKLLLLTVSAFLFAGTVCAQETSGLEGFDLMEAKVNGRVTIAGQWARFCFSGKTAEAMYYQIPTDRRSADGLACAKYPAHGKKPERFECWLDINLKKGKIGGSIDEPCGLNQEDADIAKYRAHWDAKGNKAPRTPYAPGRDDPENGQK